MKTEEYSEHRLELEGWPVNLTSYRIGDAYHAKVDNVSPGAAVSRATGTSREGAERKAIEHARRRLARTRRQSA